jgi:hypothetical protein
LQVLADSAQLFEAAVEKGVMPIEEEREARPSVRHLWARDAYFRSLTGQRPSKILSYLMTRSTVGLVLLLVTGTSLGCTKTNPLLCCSSADDCHSIGLDDSSRSCENGLVCIEHECHSAGGACLVDDQCTSPTPYCDPGVACVGCLHSDQCPPDRPTCDDQTRSCRTCVGDSDCASALCDTATGTCVAENEILYVSPAGPNAGLCEKATPCSITQANAIADLSRYTVKLEAGVYVANVKVVNKPLTIYGTGATVSQQTLPAFEVQDGGHLRLIGVTIATQSSGTSSVRCEMAPNAMPTLELRDTAIDASNGGLVANPCTLSVDHSLIRVRNTSSAPILAVTPSVVTVERTIFDGGAALQSFDATVAVTNSVLKKVGASGANGAFQGGSFNVAFSTLVDTFVLCGGSGATTLTLNSSVIDQTNSSSDAVQGSSCTIAYSVVYPQVQPLGATNVAGMSPRLQDVPAGDYHLQSSSPAIDRADPAATQPLDYDGIARPQGAGRDSGAFEYKP